MVAQCIFHDRYERINFWSHAVPGVLFLVLGGLALAGLVPGAAALFVYTCCTAVTHLSSALTHVYPDSHLLVSRCLSLLTEHSRASCEWQCTLFALLARAPARRCLLHGGSAGSCPALRMRACPLCMLTFAC